MIQNINDFDEDVFQTLIGWKLSDFVNQSIPSIICKTIAVYCFRGIHLKSNRKHQYIETAFNVTKLQKVFQDIFSNHNGFLMRFIFKLPAPQKSESHKICLMETFRDHDCTIQSLSFPISVHLQIDDELNYAVCVCIAGIEIIWHIFSDSDLQRKRSLSARIRYNECIGG